MVRRFSTFPGAECTSTSSNRELEPLHGKLFSWKLKSLTSISVVRSLDASLCMGYGGGNDVALPGSRSK